MSIQYTHTPRRFAPTALLLSGSLFGTALSGCAQGPPPQPEPLESSRRALPSAFEKGANARLESHLNGEPAEHDEAMPAASAGSGHGAPTPIDAAMGGDDAAERAAEAIVARARTVADAGASEGPSAANGDSYFRTQEFQRDFARSFLSKSEVEPDVDPDDVEQLQGIIELILEDDGENGKKARALKKLERANSKNPGPQFDFLIGQLHYEAASQLAAGVDAVTDAEGKVLAEAIPGDPEAARVAFGDSLTAFDKAIDRFPAFLRAWEKKALLHFRLAAEEPGQFAMASEAFREVLRLGQVDENTYGFLGISLMNQELYLKAETAFRNALMLSSPEDETKWRLGLANALFRQNRYADASALTQTLINADSSNAGYWMLQGNAFLGMNEIDRAAENFRIADQLGGSTFGSLNLLADIYTNEGLADLAVDSYLKALTKGDANPSRGLRGARLLVRNGDLKSVKRLLSGLQGHFGAGLGDAQLAELRKLQSQVAVREGDGETEIALLRQIIADDPMDGDAMILLGEALSRATEGEATGERVAEAIQLFETASAIEEFEAKGKLKHAQLLVRQKDYVAAIPLLKSSLQIEDKESVRNFLGGVEKAAQRAKR